MTGDARIPVTVLTGYLGAGKTTLLNRILAGGHGRRWAVLVNEFGEVGIDGDLVIGSDEELFEMNNGCVCCSVRGDLIRALHGLLQRPGRFDGVLVETTGLANPGPVVQTFLVDPVLREALRLDSITTLVDARHIVAQLATSREAIEQLAYADQIVLNKIDLVTAARLADVERQLRRVNPQAPIHQALRGQVPLASVLGRGGFDLDRIGVLDAAAAPAHGEPGHVHDAHCAHEDGHDTGHDSGHDHTHLDHLAQAGITSVSLTSTQPMDGARVQRWLTELVATQGADILRAKGIVDVAGDDRRLVFQAVHMLLEGDWQRPWRAGEPRTSRLVFIGRQLDARALQAGFDACRHASTKAEP